MTPNALKQGKFGSLGAIFLFTFLPCMWGLGLQKESLSSILCLFLCVCVKVYMCVFCVFPLAGRLVLGLRDASRLQTSGMLQPQEADPRRNMRIWLRQWVGAYTPFFNYYIQDILIFSN